MLNNSYFVNEISNFILFEIILINFLIIEIIYLKYYISN